MRATDTTRVWKVSPDLGFMGVSFFLTVFLAAPWSDSHAAASAWKPKKNVILIAPAGPGGGNDKVARVMQKVFQDRNLVEANIVIMNKPGGSGEVAWAFLNQFAADGSYLAVAPNTLLTNHITRSKALTYTDVTPVAVLAAEYNGFLVSKDSPIKSGRDLLEQLRKDPGSVSIGLGLGPGAPSHVVLSMVIKAVGGDVRKAKLVSFKSAPDALSALLGGHVDMVVTNAANATPFLQSGDVRAVASSSPRRLADPYVHVPTWREQGIDVVLIGWRAVIGPRGMSEEQLAFWDNVFAKLSKTEEWNKFLEDDLRENIYMGSKESRDFMQDDYQKLKAIFVELGLAAGR